ncbi:hypothetical protein K2173_019862 [Erythroxylum novogranatense]|uniref:Transcriptional coactivator Hfi1/Transcriptional adapter 1 n=1 Tax=Erythroxylum novogranatense TaxID=1862640 RepID=A0AAV8SMP1_9ROSI|nr:hypothetical protein K2173_019862 [Erythroxylum novogranatense]
MVSNQPYARFHTLELKSVLIKKIGHQRADRYFDLLRRLFSFKTTKSEFDKVCVKIIDRENIALHNHLIKSILKNACVAKVPPSKGAKKEGCNINGKSVNEYQRNCLQSLYGDGFASSPRKGRSPVNWDRKFRDRPSPLCPLGKPQSILSEEPSSRMQEQQSATELLSLGSRPPVEVASVEEGEEVEQMTSSPGVQSRSPVTAPFGISISKDGARKTLSNLSACKNYLRQTCLNNGELPDTRSLRSRLEMTLEAESISVSVECVNLLNNALDAYLKGLIEPCMGLAAISHNNWQLKSVNGIVTTGLNNGMFPGKYMPGAKELHYASMTEFLVSVQSNPQLLGEDRPTQLEKISLCASEE